MTTLPTASLKYSVAGYLMNKVGIPVTETSTAPYTYLASFQLFNPAEFICINSSSYIQIDIPLFNLPIDTKGLRITSQLYTQPYTSTTLTRDLTVRTLDNIFSIP